MGRSKKVECPIDGCTREHDRSLLMCALHWYRIPKDVRTEVYVSLREEGVLSERYLKARAAAIEAAS